MTQLSEPATETPDESIRYANARALTELERHHPLAESGWHVVGHSTLEGEVDTLLGRNVPLVHLHPGGTALPLRAELALQHYGLAANA